MKKRIIKVITIAIAVIMMCSCMFGTSVFAESALVQPRLNNFNTSTFVFGVDDPGIAEVVVTYSAKEEVFTQAKLTVEIQKQTFWFFWTTVDIGEPDNKWISYCTDIYGTFYKTFTVDGAGTYRAIIKLEVSGTGGTTDVVEETIESSY